VTDSDPLLGLVDDLLKLELPSGLDAATIEVEADGFAVSVTRGRVRAGVAAAAAGRSPTEKPAEEKTQRVHATTVGIFTAAKEWGPGDTVARGEVLGGIQSLGHIAEVSAPADGRIREVLVAGGAPVEYGQALFVIALG
jgi:acetyl-CoA carboxylase biotin carboxyl carrier protein